LTSANLNVAQCFFSATLCSQKGATVLQGCLLQDQEHLPDTQIMEAATTIFLDWLSVEGFGIGIGSGWNLCRVCSVSVPMSISESVYKALSLQTAVCHNMHSLQWACSLDLVMPFEKEHLATFAEVSGGHQERLREVCRTFRQMVICGCLVSNIALAMLEIFRCALREQTHKNAPPALNRGSSPEEISFRQSMEPVDAATSNCI